VPNNTVPNNAVSNNAVPNNAVSDNTTGIGEEWIAPVHYLPGAAPGPVPVGTALDELLEGNAAAVEADRASRVAVRALTRRNLSWREVERELHSRGIDEAEAAVELEQLEAHGLIDDTALAQDLVVRLQERKGYGRQAIASELARRLIAPAAIEYALDLIDSSDELARAKELAVKQAVRLRSEEHDVAVRRLSGYLARRGYTGSTVRAAVEQALGG